MKNRKIFIAAALAATFAAVPLARAQQAQPGEEKSTSAEAVVGGQWVNDVDTRGQARFEEFRDVPEGALLEFGRFSWTPKDRNLNLSLTAIDAGQRDQRYFLNVVMPALFTFKASYVEIPRFYSSGSKTLWSGAGTGYLTLSEAFRQGAENAAGSPSAPFASPALKTYIDAALAATSPFDLKTKRKDFKGSLDFRLAPGFSFAVNGRRELRDGTKPLGFGTYIRRQALSGVPGTGAGNFRRETIEVRGNELVEPVDYKTLEFGASLKWSQDGHSASVGWFGSRFRNDINALYFDNPFEATPGRSSATIFDPASDQEPPAPNGNNNLRGLYARSVLQLWPDNDYQRVFGNASLRLGGGTRLTATFARSFLKQDDAFLPYAENDQVVFSGVAGQPGVVYAKDAPLPRSSLDGKRDTTQADVRVTSRLLDALDLRAGYRYYDFDDRRPTIVFPGYSSSGDSYFRPGIGQRDATGKRILFNEVGGYTRQRFEAGAAYRFGRFTLDGAYTRTSRDYDARQVDKTVDDAFKGTVRVALGDANLNAYYLRADRDYRGDYVVGLETSGVRAFDVWTRDRDQFGADLDVPIGGNIVVGLGGSYWKDRYPGAVKGFTYGYGLQDSKSGSVYASANYTRGDFLLGASTGYDRYEWNSFQVTKTSLGADYNPTNRWTRESSDDTYWIGLETIVPLAKSVKVRGDINYQKFKGDWTTTNLATPDINSAVAYSFPELSDSTVTTRLSVLWEVTSHVTVEARYWYEPYRLNDFTWDSMQPYMQGIFKETRSSPTDIGDMNVSRFLFLDSRYTDYTAHVLSAFVHVTF